MASKAAGKPTQMGCRAGDPCPGNLAEHWARVKYKEELMVGKAFLLIVFSFAALAAVVPSTTAAQSKAGVKVGVLTCNVASGFGFIFGSSKDLKCTYAPDLGQPPERYRGRIQKFGVDIGYTEAGVIVWVVVAPTPDLDQGALTGAYAGVSAEVTAGLGLGANILVGGGNSIALQPVSIAGQRGLNVAAGIGTVVLEWVRQ